MDSGKCEGSECARELSLLPVTLTFLHNSQAEWQQVSCFEGFSLATVKAIHFLAPCFKLLTSCSSLQTKAAQVELSLLLHVAYVFLIHREKPFEDGHK